MPQAVKNRSIDVKWNFKKTIEINKQSPQSKLKQRNRKFYEEWDFVYWLSDNAIGTWQNKRIRNKANPIHMHIHAAPLPSLLFFKIFKALFVLVHNTFANPIIWKMSSLGIQKGRQFILGFRAFHWSVWGC